MANGAEAGSFGRRGSDAIQEHELIYEKLPQDIHERHVLLLVNMPSTVPPLPQMHLCELYSLFAVKASTVLCCL